jgi:hypothetical protein
MIEFFLRNFILDLLLPELIVKCQGFAKGILVELIFLSEKNSGNGKPGLFFALGFVQE